MTELSKFGSHTNYRIPPQSTGARVAHFEHWYFYVMGAPAEFSSGSTFTLSTSGIYGYIHSATAYNGGWRVLVTPNQASVTDGFVVDEVFTIIHPNGTSYTGSLKAWDAVLLPEMALVDAERPNHYLAIDNLGAASVRFTEGEPQFDPYGQMRMVQSRLIASYSFHYGSSAHVFLQESETGGTFAHEPAHAAVNLDVTADAASRVCFTSNKYHRYNPGVAFFISMSVRVGDTGKANCVRRWGYFDSRNGIFFEQDGADLYTVIRSDVSGTVVDTRVIKGDWIKDKLDGAGGVLNPSEMTLDLTKNNVFWFDFQWHGAGIVRYGIYSDAGNRILVNVIENANKNVGPYMGTATLPVKYEIINTAATASPSRMTIGSSAIFREGVEIQDNEANNTFVRSWLRPTPVAVTDTKALVGAFRAMGTYNGKHNHKFIVPKYLNWMVLGTNAVEITIYAGTVFSSGTWTVASPVQSTAEVTIDGVIPVEAARGLMVSTIFLPPGATRQQVSEVFNSLSSSLYAIANSTPGTVFSVWGRTLETSTTATLHSGLDWVEV